MGYLVVPWRAVYGESRTYGSDWGKVVVSYEFITTTYLSVYFDGDQLYGFFLFERVMTQALSVIHPSQLLFSTTTPGLADRILLLEQNYICIENFINDQDPDVIDLFEVVQQKKQGAV